MQMALGNVSLSCSWLANSWLVLLWRCGIFIFMGCHSSCLGASLLWIFLPLLLLSPHLLSLQLISTTSSTSSYTPDTTKTATTTRLRFYCFTYFIFYFLFLSNIHSFRLTLFSPTVICFNTRLIIRFPAKMNSLFFLLLTSLLHLFIFIF